MGRLRFFSFSGAAARCADRAFCFRPANESPARVRGACVPLIVDNPVASFGQFFICVGRFSSESKAFADATSAGRRFFCGGNVCVSAGETVRLRRAFSAFCNDLTIRRRFAIIRRFGGVLSLIVRFGGVQQ